MIRAFSPLLLGALLVPGLVQDSGKLRPISSPTATDSARSDDVDDLIARLSSPEFSERKSAAAELEKLGQKALPKLKAIVKSSQDPDLRFQARRLIRRIQGRDKGLGRVEPKTERPSSRAGQGRDLGDVQDEMERQLDEVRKRLEEMGIRGGLRPFDFHDFDDMFRDLPKGGQTRSKSSSQSTKVKVGPDGVEVEVDDNGKTKRYTAPDMETLLKTHPELRGRVGGSTRIHIGKPGELPQTMKDQFERMRREMERMRRSFGRDFDRDWPNTDVDKNRDKNEPKPLRRIEPKKTDEGPKLGVMISPASPQVVAFLGLPAGVGLMVEEVVEGSTADKIGLKEGDLVAKVNGKWIRSPDDVADALRSGKGVAKVEYYRKGQKRSAGGK